MAPVGRQMQRRRAAAEWRTDVGSGLQQHFHHIHAIHQNRVMQRRGAGLLVAGVHVRPAGDEQPGNFRMARPGGVMQRCAAQLVEFAGIGAGLEQLPHAFQVAPARRLVQIGRQKAHEQRRDHCLGTCPALMMMPLSRRRATGGYNPCHARIAPLPDSGRPLDCRRAGGAGPFEAPDHSQGFRSLAHHFFGDAFARRPLAGLRLHAAGRRRRARRTRNRHRTRVARERRRAAATAHHAGGRRGPAAGASCHPHLVHQRQPLAGGQHVSPQGRNGQGPERAPPRRRHAEKRPSHHEAGDIGSVAHRPGEEFPGAGARRSLGRLSPRSAAFARSRPGQARCRGQTRRRRRGRGNGPAGAPTRRRGRRAADLRHGPGAAGARAGGEQ